MKFINELKWRELIFDKTPGVEDFFSNEKVTGYIGFDPTSKSLHVGNLLPIMNLVRLQKYGHTPIALVGGGTGLIGDPSGKSEERKILTDFQIQENLNSIESVTKFLEKYRGNVTLIKGDTNKVLKDYDFKEIDYVFLDGGHSYETVINDLHNLYNNLKDKRRIILCDDYNHPECPGLKKAIDEFAKTYHLKLEIIHGRFAELTT